MKNNLIIGARILLGLMMIIFGANKILGFIEVPPPAGEAAQAFMGAMFTSYLAKLVAFTQVAGGVLLLIPRTAFLGLILLLPIMVNIVAYHFAHDLPGNGLWLLPTILTVIIIWGFASKFPTLLNKPSV